MKVANIDREILQIFEFNFKEKCDLKVNNNNIKSHKKQGFTLSLGDTFFEKPQREGRVKLNVSG